MEASEAVKDVKDEKKDVKNEKKNVNKPVADLKTIDVDAIEDVPSVESKREI